MAKRIVSILDMMDFIALARRIGTDTQEVEVKSAAAQLPKDAVETISAFANASGGTLILGLSEKAGFKPVQGFDAKRAIDFLGQLCDDKLEPPIRATIRIIPFEGSPVVVAEIPELAPYLKPCYVKSQSLYGGSYIRTGDGDRKLSRYEVDRILEEHMQPRFDEEMVREAEPDDLDDELVAGFLAKERSNSTRLFSKLSDEDALITMKVLSRDEDGSLHPTIAGLLALGFHPQQFFPRLNVTFAVFPGLTKGELTKENVRFLDSKTIIGPIPVMIAETLAALRRNMRTVSYMERAFRRDTAEYPETAVREALANALMHRDYSPEGRGSQVQVNVFPDRIEILNVGGLYGAVTVDQLGKYGVSASRNERLSRILESTPYPDGYSENGFIVENKGTGYAMIKSSLSQAHMPEPEAVDTVSTFVLTMRKHRWDVERQHNEDMPSFIDETDGRILTWLEETGPSKATCVADAVGVSQSTASRRLRRLCNEGYVERIGATNSPHLRYRRVKRKLS